jgi:hypothetical protein
VTKHHVKYCYRGLLAGLFVFIGGCVGSCDKAHVRLLGTVTEAQVTGFSRSDNDTENLRYVKYTWRSDDGREMRGYDKVDMAWQPPPSGLVEIRYLPKANVRGKIYKSQLVENSRDTSLVMMLGGFVMIIIFGSWSFWELKRTMPAP